MPSTTDFGINIGNILKKKKADTFGGTKRDKKKAKASRKARRKNRR